MTSSSRWAPLKRRATLANPLRMRQIENDGFCFAVDGLFEFEGISLAKSFGAEGIGSGCALNGFLPPRPVDVPAG